MQTKYFDRFSVRGPFIQDPPHPGLGLVVVIPALNEPELLKALESLRDCTAPPEPVEVIVVINHSEEAPADITQSNLQLYNQSVSWSQEHSTDRFRVHVLYQPDLPARKAGVGLARKIGMDEAVRRCMALGKPAIPVACFDADCMCSENYLEDLQGFFARNPELEGCAIYFEHPYATLSPEHRRAIVAYELHLRYFIQAQRWADFPFAFQTLGSAMAVRADTYCQVGGMNTRQAGEDFYFLHKVIERGHFADLTRACVYPSPRTSWRVPFGTGRAMQTDLEKNITAKTTNPMIFRDLRTMIGCVREFHVSDAKDYERVIAGLPASMKEFFTTIEAEDKIMEIRENTASAAAFEKRFSRWFNAFRVMKYSHFARDKYYPNVELSAAVGWLCGQLGVEVSLDSQVDMLLALRDLDKRPERTGRSYPDGSSAPPVVRSRPSARTSM